MVTKKPARRLGSLSKSSDKLMGHQDLKNKGDSTARKKDKCITFWVSEEQKREISTYASDHNTTVSRLIIEGLEMRMDRG